MPHANRPAGRGKPINEQHDAVVQQEGLEELAADRAEADDPGAAIPDPVTSARHAERSAHTKGDADTGADAATGRRQPS